MTNESTPRGFTGVLAGLLVLLLLYMTGAMGYISSAVRSCGDLRVSISQAVDPDVRADLRQQLQACLGKQVTQPEATVSSVQPVPTASVSTPPSASATPTPPADNERGWDAFSKEYLVGMRNKLSVNSYGPPYTLFVEPLKTPLDDLSARQFLRELELRMPYSPTLTASLGATFKHWSWNDANSKIKLFLREPDEWRSAAEVISEDIDKAIKGSRKVTKPAGLYDATFALIGDDGIPYIKRNRDNEPIRRPTSFKAVVLPNGAVLRMACGGQQYWKHKSAPDMSTFAKTQGGVTRDYEGTPVVVTTHRPRQATRTTPGKPSTTGPATTRPATTKPARKDPREDVNVNPQIPKEEQVKPTQKAEPNQAQPTEPAAPATTRRENPPAPAPETKAITTRATVPKDEGGAPTGQPDGP